MLKTGSFSLVTGRLFLSKAAACGGAAGTHVIDAMIADRFAESQHRPDCFFQRDEGLHSGCSADFCMTAKGTKLFGWLHESADQSGYKKRVDHIFFRFV